MEPSVTNALSVPFKSIHSTLKKAAQVHLLISFLTTIAGTEFKKLIGFHKEIRTNYLNKYSTFCQALAFTFFSIKYQR